MPEAESRQSPKLSVAQSPKLQGAFPGRRLHFPMCPTRSLRELVDLMVSASRWRAGLLATWEVRQRRGQAEASTVLPGGPQASDASPTSNAHSLRDAQNSDAVLTSAWKEK